jgi:hypothetical protein
MSLPDSAPRTIAATERVARADVLAAQDSMIAMYQRGRRHAPVTWIPAAAAARKTGFGTTGLAYIAAANAGDEIVLPIRLPVGARLQSVTARIYRAAGTNMSMSVNRWPYSTATAAALATAAGGTTTTWVNLTATIAYPYHPITEGYGYSIQLLAGQTGDRVSTFAIAWTRD